MFLVFGFLATFFLEFWKRYQKSIEYDWDVADFEFEEVCKKSNDFKTFLNKKWKMLSGVDCSIKSWILACVSHLDC